MPGDQSRANGKRGGRPHGTTGKQARTVAKEAGRVQALKDLEIDAHWTMQRIARTAGANLADCLDEAGQLQNLKDLPPEVQITVASLKTLKTNVVSGDGKQETTREIKLWDKMRALELLARHFDLVTDKHEVTVKGQLELVAAALDRMKERNRAKSS